MKKRKIAMTLMGILLLVPIGAFFVLGLYSGRQEPMTVGLEEVFSCGEKPNCVCSEDVRMPSQAIEPLALNGVMNGQNSQQVITDAIKATGGQVVDSSPELIVATYTSKIFGFVDDVAIKINDSAQRADVISRSRVGYSDLQANRKRVEKIRAALVAN